MPRRRGPPPPRPRPRPRLPPGDRDRRLAEEVLYLHSLWRGGPSAPSPASAIAGRKTIKLKRRRLDSSATAAAEPQDTGSEWARAPSPPNPSPQAWPEAAPVSASPAKPPPPPASPGAHAQLEALRAAAEFFSNRSASSSSSDEDDDDGSESEGKQDAAEFITDLFKRDAALRGHYERGWEKGQFACLACASGARKPGRRFRGCVALVQHAHDAARYGRPRAHRALAAVVCRVLGWVFGRLPSIVRDPRGTLGQALAAEAAADVQLGKGNGDIGESNDSSSDEDEEEDVETGMEDSSTGDDEEEDVEKGMEDYKNIHDDEEATELDNCAKSAEKEDMGEIGPSNYKDIKNKVLHNGSVHEEENVGENKEEHDASTS